MPGCATDRFYRLAEAKQESVIAAAIAEFAAHGFDGANTNRIAAAAGISVGSLFKYFDTKDDLFRHVVSLGAQVIEANVVDLIESDAPVISKLEQLIRISIVESRQNQEFMAMYHELTTIGNREVALDVSREWESFTARGYREVIAQGQASGEVRDDLTPEMIAFLVDSLLMILQFTATSEYYKDRLHIFVGEVDDDELVRVALDFVVRGIGAK